MEYLETPTSWRFSGPLTGVETAYNPDGGRSDPDRALIAEGERGGS